MFKSSTRNTSGQVLRMSLLATLGLARISHQCVDTWAKGIDEDIRKEDRLN
ncbi:MAG: hypothetical protein ACHBNF_06870 [Chromatiales bacterium]